MRLSHLRCPVPSQALAQQWGCSANICRIPFRINQEIHPPPLGATSHGDRDPDPGFHEPRSPHCRHTQTAASLPHCLPSDAFDCWFYSSPFSLSVLENHKETPRCSWNSCQRDSSRIEHMALSFHTNKDIATFSALASFLLPAWAPHLAQVRGGSVCAWLATHESPGLAGSPSSHPEGAPGVAWHGL